MKTEKQIRTYLDELRHKFDDWRSRAEEAKKEESKRFCRDRAEIIRNKIDAVEHILGESGFVYGFALEQSAIPKRIFTASSETGVCANCGNEKHVHYVGAVSGLFQNNPDEPHYCDKF